MWLQPPSLATRTIRLHIIGAVLRVHCLDEAIRTPPTGMLGPLSSAAFTFRDNLAPPVRLVCMVATTDGAVRCRWSGLEIGVGIFFANGALDGRELCLSGGQHTLSG